MTHGSLFSGIGGFDLASEWMGWKNLFHCEWNEFGQKVLKYYWPEAELFIDIKKSNFTKYANKIDVLTGGFPCQPYSSAGKRLGKEDDRHLWPEMLRAIREIQPRYVVGENVRGLTNWNGGLVFDEVQADLEAEGYKVLPFLLPACAVNAPHRRDRIWFIAYSSLYANGLRTEGRLDLGGQLLEGREGKKETNGLDNIGKNEYVTNTNCNGFNQCNCEHEINASETRIDAFSNINEGNVNGNASNTNSGGTQSKQNLRQKVSGKERINSNGTQSDASNTKNIRSKNTIQNGKMERGKFMWNNKRNQWDTFPSVTPICVGDDGLSDRLDSITFPKWRNESIKAGGNAIVPQVAFQIFKAINELEKLNNEFQR
jgi:DNA (cytosine-5)-methyltransferase 1